MPTPAQPAPVTPPPECSPRPWKYRFSDIVANDDRGVRGPTVICQMVGSPGNPAVIADGKFIIEAVNAYRPAPPPAPSCPTERGEGLTKDSLAEQIELSTFAHCSCGGSGREHPDCCPACHIYHDLHKILDEAALSRQPAPAADASSQTGEGIWPAFARHLNEKDARIASLEADLAECERQFQDMTQALLTEMVEHDATKEKLRAAPSAVAGGGEDGARLDWLEKHANFIEVGHIDIGPTRIEIDAAIAATKAKEGTK